MRRLVLLNLISAALFVACVRNRKLAFDPGGVKAQMLRALEEAWGRPADLVVPAISLVKLEPAIGEGCARAAAAWPKRIAGDELTANLPAIVDDRLLRAILENVPVCDVGLERLLTALRVVLLANAARGQASRQPTGLRGRGTTCRHSDFQFMVRVPQSVDFPYRPR